MDFLRSRTLLCSTVFSTLLGLSIAGCGDDDGPAPGDGGMTLPDGAPVDGGVPPDGAMGPDGSMPPTSSELFPPPTITTCAGDSLPPPASGACDAPTPGSTDALLITGDILTPGEIFRGGQVLVDAEGLIACVGCDCSGEPTAAAATTLVCPDAVVSPGLINGHDHVTFDNGEPYGTSGQQTEERFEHRHDWRRGLDGHLRINSRGGRARTEEMQWVELRQLMSGTTSIFGSGGPDGLLRNLDRNGAPQHGLGRDAAEYQTFPLGDSGRGNQKRSDRCDYDFSDSASDVAEEEAYVPHMAEGIDEAARNEFRCARDGERDLIQPQTAIIHGTGLTAEDIGELAAEGAKLVWSPRTNITLYGDTARVTEYARLGVPIGLGTDWIATGSMNMLRELQCADSFNANHLGGFFTDEQLWLMATRNTALALGFGEVLGTLQAGQVADIAIYDARERSDHRAVLAARPQDVLLVLRGGQVLFGDSTVVSGLADDCEAAGDVCGMTAVCGASKHVCLRDLGTSLAELAAENTEMYPLCFCEEPEFEPTCVPSRNHMGGEFPDAMVNGSNYYSGMSSADDIDADGIPNAADNCMGIFNPIRPLDGGAQADADGDGIGDACDICPLGNDETPEACNAVDPNDRDADDVPDMMDNCPRDANPDQADMDEDGKGDVCDACPMEPNPGAALCPALATTVYALRAGDIEEGREVTLSGLVVTGLLSNGIILQQLPGTPDYEGVDLSGLFIFTGGAPSGVSVGDVLAIERATYATFMGGDQLQEATWSTLESGASVEPVAAVPAEIETSGARAEALHHVVVRVEDLTVTEPDLDFGRFAVDDGLLIGPEIFAITPPPVAGERFRFVQGPLAFTFAETKITPRSQADVGFTSLRVSPSEATVAPEATLEITVAIPETAAAGGAIVSVSAEPAGLLSVGPSEITIAEGSSTATASFTAAAVEVAGTLTFTFGEQSASLSLEVVQPVGDGLLFSEYIEGTSSNKALEIWNNTGEPLDLSACAIRTYFNGADEARATIDLEGTLAAGDVYVVCNPGIENPAICDLQDGGINHNGNDAYDLVCDGMVADTFGRIGEDPGELWETGDVGTRDTVLRRKCTVGEGDTVGDDAFDPSAEWDAFDLSDFSGFGSHC